MSALLESFGAATRAWFAEHFDGPTEVQRRGWEAIGGGRHALLAAPTGSGKTLAAFLWGIDALSHAAPDPRPGVRLLYVSPLKALVYDVERNLRAPLAGVRVTAERLGLAATRPLRADVRTGDTPQRERQRQLKDPGEILVTTPESLFLLLGSRARANLATVETVIVDEIHALAPVKRGSHLTLSLERLADLCEGDPQRIGLSATARPLDGIARFLGGDREVEIVDATAPPSVALRIVVPVADMTHVTPPEREKERGGSILAELAARDRGAPGGERGIWPAVYPELVRAIREHRSTIVFVNSRGLCERLTQRLNELAGEELALAHHGSVSHEKRAQIEDALKAGRVRAIVATSSLELGIDMGAVDHVILVESPGSVSRGLQRVGRAGHQVGAVSAGTIYPKFRGDLLECAVVAQRMQAGAIEAVEIPRSPLDVLAQQIVALCCDAEQTVDAIHALVRRAHPYRELSRDALVSVLDMLTGHFPSSDLADLRPRLSWDRARDVLLPRRGTPMLSRLNAGTIPDRGTFAVHLGADGPRVGELDEEMVYESREGDTFLLGASTWRVEDITRDRVVVSPAPGEPGRLPFWKGDGPGRPKELGRALGAFTRELGALDRESAERYLAAELPLDERAAANLAAYVDEQKQATGTLPTDRALTVERFRDELGDWRVCILSPFGSRVHAPWAMALSRELSRRAGFEVQVMYTDDGIVLRFADADEAPPLEALFPSPDEIDDLVIEELGETSLFAALFRENAVRSLLVPRRRPDRRNPLWAQRLKARSLLATVRRFPSFPIVIETYRQALSDVFDLPGLRELLRAVATRAIEVREVETRAPSPFARSLVFAYVAAYLYDQDAPLAERRAQALTLDKSLLNELVGEIELRELIDPVVLAELEAELQALADERKARDADELHDLLRRLGDLDEPELSLRAVADPVAWLALLEEQRRAVRVSVAGTRRWIAAEDAGLYRDALGCAPPPGLPEAFVAPVPDPLRALVARWARTHGPFDAREPAARFGLRPAQIEPVLGALERDGLLVHGEIRPGGATLDRCDAEVLRQLKRRTLARLRGEVAAVDALSFARFLPAWHGLGPRARSGQRLAEALVQLEGLPVAWSTLVDTLLPQRVPGFTPEALDELSAAGELVWVGRGALGPKDGRVELWLREHADAIEPAPEPESERPALERAILEHLERRGASFLVEIERSVRERAPDAGPRDLEAALWSLVWGGEVTNDTFLPLRSLGRGARTGRPTRRRAPPLAGGRWSLVRLLGRADAATTERVLARTHVLLERYGIVGRDAVGAESVPGGFGPIYKALRALEEAGRVRRGHFVEGLAGAQFGHVGAVERLRDARIDPGAPRRAPELVTLSAIDPANPWGALLPWPETGAGDDARPRRVPGAWVVLADGAPVVWLAPKGRQVLTFAGTRAELLLEGLRALTTLPHRRGRGLLVVERVDGVAAERSPHQGLLLAAGFVADYRGFVPAPRTRGAAE